jgi:hypothetical protein
MTATDHPGGTMTMTPEGPLGDDEITTEPVTEPSEPVGPGGDADGADSDGSDGDGTDGTDGDGSDGDGTDGTDGAGTDGDGTDAGAL